MSTIVTRAGKGSPLTNNEVDNNFTNLNTDKIQSGDTVASLDINGGTIDGTAIGGATPAAGAFTTLSASSTLSVTGAGTIQGLTVGRGAGAVGTNTAVGASALAANTSGAQNTAVGNNSQPGTTSGSFNVSVGSTALYTNTTSSGSVAIGFRAAYNTNGNFNTAIGSGFTAFTLAALENNTTGTNNIAVGSGALGSNTTASNNTAVGYQALYSNTTATENTAVGYQALFSQTTASTGQNIAFGLQAGYATNGFYNTFIGYKSGLPSTGNQNTFIGHGSGSAMTTGSKNTILGIFSGNQGGLDIRTANNYIVLSDGDGNPRLTFDNYGQITKTGTANAFNSTIDSIQDFDAASRFGFNGLANNNDGIFFGTGINNGIPSGIAFYREGSGWNTAIGFFTNYVTSGPESTSAMQQKLLLTSSGALSLFNGDKAPGGTGICFPATQNASSNANTLDDYERGTVGGLVATCDSGSITLDASSTITYTKIGNRVFYTGFILVSSVSSPSGNVYFTGAFTSAGPNTAGSIAPTGSFNSYSGYDLVIRVQSGQSQIYLQKSGVTTGELEAAANLLKANSRFEFQIAVPV